MRFQSWSRCASAGLVFRKLRMASSSGLFSAIRSAIFPVVYAHEGRRGRGEHRSSEAGRIALLCEARTGCQVWHPWAVSEANPCGRMPPALHRQGYGTILLLKIIAQVTVGNAVPATYEESLRLEGQ